MTAPVVSWRTRDNSQQLLKWELGVVDAGTTSRDFGFLIWNNYRDGTGNGETDVANMEDCTITVKDEFGGDTGDLVTGQWIEVRVDNSTGDGNFHKIGFDVVSGLPVTHPIQTNGSTVYNGVISTPNVPPHTSANGTVSILGVANDGTKENSAGNYVEITLRANVPSNASSGLIKFLTRVSYKYV